MVSTEILTEFHMDWLDEHIDIEKDNASYYSSGRVIDGPLSPFVRDDLDIDKILSFFKL